MKINQKTQSQIKRENDFESIEFNAKKIIELIKTGNVKKLTNNEIDSYSGIMYYLKNAIRDKIE